MITVFPHAELGHANHGWLDARHHFSFARYYNPARVGFGTLRVINDDRVAAGKGFGTHPHDNMEIITYVRSGAITHKDSLGNEGRTNAGDVQVMSAGSGIFHSEYNMENEDTTLFQIWIRPNVKDATPRWDSMEFPKESVTESLPLLVSGQAESAGNALFINQDAAIYGGRLKAGTQVIQNIKHQAYALSSYGDFKIEDTVLHGGDGAEITETKTVTITALSDAEVIIIDVP